MTLLARISGTGTATIRPWTLSTISSDHPPNRHPPSPQHHPQIISIAMRFLAVVFAFACTSSALAAALPVTMEGGLESRSLMRRGHAGSKLAPPNSRLDAAKKTLANVIDAMDDLRYRTPCPLARTRPAKKIPNIMQREPTAESIPATTSFRRPLPA